MDKTLLKLSGVSKSFDTKLSPVRRLFSSLLYRGGISGKTLYALNDISITINRGESVGIVGLNGSGKSTLLQIIAGTLMPSAGTVLVNGKVAAILELGSGFNPNFTGVENVHLNGSLFGLSRNEIEEILPEILDFAGIGDYAKLPVSTYSSGMVVRLAYSIISQLNPDILLVDEALAVGDFLFQQKCINSMKSMQEKGCAILFVSHSLNLVSEFCTKMLILEKGNEFFYGSAKKGIHIYEERLLEMREQESSEVDVGKNFKLDDYLHQSDAFKINSLVSLKSCEICDSEKKSVSFIKTHKFMTIKVVLSFKKGFDDPHCGFKIIDEFGRVSFGINTYSLEYNHGPIGKGESVGFEFSLHQKLAPGKYSITIGVANGGYGFPRTSFMNVIAYIDNAKIFEVVPNSKVGYWSGAVKMKASVNSSISAHVC